MLHLAFANLPRVFPNPVPCGGVRVSNLTSSAVSWAAPAARPHGTAQSQPRRKTKAGVPSPLHKQGVCARTSPEDRRCSPRSIELPCALVRGIFLSLSSRHFSQFLLVLERPFCFEEVRPNPEGEICARDRRNTTIESNDHKWLLA